MMLINLLPHRQQQRQRSKKEFQVSILASLLGSVIACGLLYAWLHTQYQQQLQRNAFLRAEIALLNQEITEIEGLEAEISHLSAQQKSVETLQMHRNVPVHLLNQLVRQLPQGIYITSLKQSAGVVELRGVASSNERISELLRSFAAVAPKLKEIEAFGTASAPLGLRPGVRFSMSFPVALFVQAQVVEGWQSTAATRRVD